jgi:hypothetical protein
MSSSLNGSSGEEQSVKKNKKKSAPSTSKPKHTGKLKTGDSSGENSGYESPNKPKAKPMTKVNPKSNKPQKQWEIANGEKVLDHSRALKRADGDIPESDPE